VEFGSEPIIHYREPMVDRAVVLALLSAALFGFSTPAAKALLGSVDSTMLAGLLYCGAGVGVAVPRASIPGYKRKSNVYWAGPNAICHPFGPQSTKGVGLMSSRSTGKARPEG
jgi:hypothetical protein